MECAYNASYSGGPKAGKFKTRLDYIDPFSNKIKKGWEWGIVQW
jgi:hypothetical protein